MRILYTYIVREILKLLFPIWIALGLLLFVLEWLARVFVEKASASVVLELYLYKVPSHLQIAFPVAALFSCLAVLGSMNRNREIVAAESFGIKRRTIFAATALAILLASIPSFWIMNSLAPWGMRNHYDLYDKEVLHQESHHSLIQKEKIWYRNRDVLYNVGYFFPDTDELADISIYTFDEKFHIAQTLKAKRAVWNGNNWILMNGVVTLTDSGLRTPLLEHFDVRSTKLIEAPRNLKRVDREADTMGQSELYNFIQRNRSLGINTAKWEVVYHGRYSFMIIPFILLLIIFPLALRFRRGGGTAQDSLFVIAVSLTYWLIYNFAMGLGASGKIHPILSSWGPSLVFLVAAFLYNRTRNLRTESA